MKRRLDEITLLLKQRPITPGDTSAKMLQVPVCGKVAAGMGAENQAQTEEPEASVEIPERLLQLPWS